MNGKDPFFKSTCKNNFLSSMSLVCDRSIMRNEVFSSNARLYTELYTKAFKLLHAKNFMVRSEL